MIFLTTSDYKKKHDFLKHYNKGEDDLFGDNPIDIEKSCWFVKVWNNGKQSRWILWFWKLPGNCWWFLKKCTFTF